MNGSDGMDKDNKREFSGLSDLTVTETEKTANFSGADTARSGGAIPTSVLTFLAT
jgi:hypothetical protein